MIKVSKYIKKKIKKSKLKEIFKITNTIEDYPNQKEVNQRIQKSNVKGTDSQVIQNIIEEIAIPLGFMDLLDIYKCHICEEANHLFLFISIEVRHTKNIYKSVCKKMENFFYEENYLNIDSATVFGY